MASMNGSNSAMPTRGEDAHPLGVGARAPGATLRTIDGQPFDLAEAYHNGPVMLIFYRGGWCPYCNRHLQELRHAEAPLREMGVRLLAVSPDQPSKLQESRVENEVSYELLSDSTMKLSRAFGLAFRVDDDTIERYHGFGIDLEAASGQSHFQLPVPAVYLIDRQGVIRFAHFDPDYKVRLSADDVVTAARSTVGETSR